MTTTDRCARAWALATTLAGLTSPAGAGEPMDWRLEASHPRYRATEYRPGTPLVLNREEGHLHTLALRAGQCAGSWCVSGALSHGSGQLDYQGYTQIGLPLSTRTDLRITELSVQGGPHGAWPALALGWRVDAGWQHRRIHRAIQATPFSAPLTETLSADDAVNTLTLHWPADVTAWHLETQARQSWPLQQRLRVDSHGRYDPFVLRPAARSHSQIGVAVRSASHGPWQFGAGWRHQQLHFGASDARTLTRNGQLAGVASYPGSTQTWQGLWLEARLDLSR